MGDIGVPELLIILAIAIAVFGAGRLAGAGKALGTSIKEFRRAIRDDEPEAAVTTTPEMAERREAESRTVS
jgi:sec-independent protein translocase protein TatA